MKQEKKEEPEDGVQLSLLSVSPMARMESVEDEKELEVFDETAVNFSSQTHAEHIHNIFQYYGVDVNNWTVCQTADNCSVNLKVEELLKIPHVACTNNIFLPGSEQNGEKFIGLGGDDQYNTWDDEPMQKEIEECSVALEFGEFGSSVA